MRSPAFALTFEFVFAFPDYPAVLICAIPGLGTEVVTTVSADQSGGEDALTTVTPYQHFSPSKLLLHPIKQEQMDNRLIAVLHIVEYTKNNVFTRYILV